jgi:hypothetical protein
VFRRFFVPHTAILVRQIPMGLPDELQVVDGASLVHPTFHYQSGQIAATPER